MTIANPSTHRKQAKKPNPFAVWVKTRLIRRGMRVNDLIPLVNRSRGSVSVAINQPNDLPHVAELIKEALKD